MNGLRVAVARCKWGWWTREWPWRVPPGVVNIGTKRPPEHVFEFFRRLHSGATPANGTCAIHGQFFSEKPGWCPACAEARFSNRGASLSEQGGKQ